MIEARHRCWAANYSAHKPQHHPKQPQHQTEVQASVASVSSQIGHFIHLRLVQSHFEWKSHARFRFVQVPAETRVIKTGSARSLWPLGAFMPGSRDENMPGKL